MKIRLLLATPDAASLSLLQAVFASAMELLPLDVSTEHAGTASHVLSRAAHKADDVVILDWPLAHEKTPALIRELLATYPGLRIVTILPLGYRQYRLECWNAGACAGIAREHLNQDWLSSVLCIMRRAMEREARVLARLEAAEARNDAVPEMAVSTH